MVAELRAAYDEAENDDDIWLLIVTGTGRAFCTGADVERDPRGRQGDLRTALPVHLRPVGGAAGGHAAVPADGQTGAHRHQRNVLRRRAGLGHHRRHRRSPPTRPPSSIRTSASAWWPAARWCGWPGCCRATVALRMALMGKHERMSAQRAYELGHDQRGRRARPTARTGPRDRRHRELECAAGGSGHPAGHPQDPGPAAARGARSSPRRSASASCAPRTRRRARRRSWRSAPRTGSADDRRSRRILLDVDAGDHVATITLNRPGGAQRVQPHHVRGDGATPGASSSSTTRVNAVVLRAAGDRAFSAGLDIKTPYGQPDNVWNHEDPGELLSPKWQKMWKPVVCAVQGMCTAGAFYFVNEVRRRDLLAGRHVLRLARQRGPGLRAGADRADAPHRPRARRCESRLMGNDERVGADTALRIGLVTEVVAAERLWARAHEIAAAIAAKPTVGDPGHRQGDLGVAGQALPGRAGAGPDLHPAG